MNPAATAAVWAGAGVAGAAILPAIRLRRLAVLVPLAALAALLSASALPEVTLPAAAQLGPLHLDRTAQGLLMATAVSLALFLVLAPTVQGRELATLGAVAAAALVATTATDPVVWALALVIAVGVLSLRWITVAPGRVTLAAGRIAIAAGAALLAATAFLPVTVAVGGPRPVLVAALLGCGLAALLGLLPLGGWALGGLRTLGTVDAAGWLVILAPAALLSAIRVELALPPESGNVFGAILLTLGLLTALWNGAEACRGSATSRYPRIFLADLALAAAAVGSGHLAAAQAGGLFLVLTHLLLSPLLMHPGDPRTAQQRRIAWLLLSGVPPAPSFWGRFLLLTALGAVSVEVLVLSVAAIALLSIASALAFTLEPRATSPSATPRGKIAVPAAAWLITGGGILLGLVSEAGARFIFGGP